VILLELLVFVVVAFVILGVGIRIGILAARRIGRLTGRDEDGR
jgi:hypothetical protein